MSEPLPCPSCRNTMESLAFPRPQGGEVSLDLCWCCQGIWFDSHESTQLAPGGIVALFQTIHKNREATRPVAEPLQCPRCTGPLAYAQDMTKSGRFAYYHCVAAHGRFTPFTQFLIEKGFIRALSNVEIAALKVEVKIISCSSCGAPVDLQCDTACTHCGSPIAVLDAQAVEKALAAYTKAGQARALSQHDVVAELILQQERDRLEQERAGITNRIDAVDLIGASMGAILGFLT